MKRKTKIIIISIAVAVLFAGIGWLTSYIRTQKINREIATLRTEKLQSDLAAEKQARTLDSLQRQLATLIVLKNELGKDSVILGNIPLQIEEKNNRIADSISRLPLDSILKILK